MLSGRLIHVSVGSSGGRRWLADEAFRVGGVGGIEHTGPLLTGDFGGAVVNVGGRVKPRSASRNATGLEVIDDRMVCTITIAGVEELESRELL